MAEYKVHFLPDDQTLAVPEGTTLLEAAFRIGIGAVSPCGGKGICGKCRMEVLEGAQTGICLACKTRVSSDMKVKVLQREQEGKILITGTTEQVKLNTGLWVCELEVPTIIPGEADSVWERVRDTIAASPKAKNAGIAAEQLRYSLSVLGKMYRTIKAGDQHIYAVLYNEELLDVSADLPEPMIFAVDIGTTTLAGYLINGKNGEVLVRVSEKNPQSKFGADVISRADYVLEHGGQEMAACVREVISAMLARAAAESGTDGEQTWLTVLAGNTCMHHLFLELSPESLVHAPYSPVIRQSMELPAENYIRNTAPGCKLKFLPNIAGFVGADTIACLIACDFEQEDKMTLLMDIGTNGELVLGNRKRSAACSTAAGPAFEGAKISCGMRGTNGAIEHVTMTDGELQYSVIGDTQPTGICGSGLLDVMAILVEYGFVDLMGMFCEPEQLKQPEAVRNRERIRGSGMERCLVLYEDVQIGNIISVTQKDIGEVQLAKAAMAAGIRILCKCLDIQESQIEQVLIAGAFGNYMDSSSACRIGLIPRGLQDKIKAIGNAAGEGAVLASLDQDRWRSGQRMTEVIEFAELAAEPSFSDIFVEELEF